MSRAVLLLATLSLAACTTAPPPTTATRPVITGPQIIPAPASLTMGAGAPYEVTRATSIVVDGSSPEVTAIAQGLGALMRKSTGFPLVVSTADTAANGKPIDHYFQRTAFASLAEHPLCLRVGKTKPGASYVSCPPRHQRSARRISLEARDAHIRVRVFH